MSMRNPSVFWGVILIGVGILLLLANTGVLESINWDYIWPLVLIAIGVWLISRRLGRTNEPPPPPLTPPAEK